MKALEAVIGNVRFGKNPKVFMNKKRHFADREGSDKSVVFWIDKDKSLDEGFKGSVYFKTEEEDKYGNVKLASVSLQPFEWEEGDYNANNSGSTGASNSNTGEKKGRDYDGYNKIQEKRNDYDQNVKDPKLTIQGLMSNYTTIAVELFKAGKDPKDAEKLADWVLNRAMADAEKLYNHVTKLNEENEEA